LQGYWLGVCISSRAMQLLVEASYNVQMLLMLCCILYILGGMLYYLAPSMWAVIFSKIFSGIALLKKNVFFDLHLIRVKKM
jgi:predicted MFS family arabinose efflux permease